MPWRGAIGDVAPDAEGALRKISRTAEKFPGAVGTRSTHIQSGYTNRMVRTVLS